MTLVSVLLRIEGFVAFAAATLLYATTGSGWVLFALLILAPDVFMLGYLRDARTGAWIYNLGHTYVAPVLLAGVGYFGAPLLLQVGLVWIAHIGMDRALGFGLKLPGGFRITHLQLAPLPRTEAGA